LYEEPEKPANALDFVKMTLGAPTGVDVEALKAENDQLREKNDAMTQKIVELTKKVRARACRRVLRGVAGASSVAVRAGAAARRCGREMLGVACAAASPLACCSCEGCC
jgi:hypothetical protein